MKTSNHSTSLSSRVRNNPLASALMSLFLITPLGSTQAQSNESNSKNTSDMDTIKIDFETLKRDHWSEKEQANAQVMIDFVQHLMNDHDFEYVRKKHGDDNYTQHNRGIADGMEALVQYVEGFAKRYPDYTYDVKHIYADGDFITFHSHSTLKAKHRGNDSKGLNIIDTWRVKDGEILEHWDSIQPIDGFMRFFIWMNGGKVRNGNGLF